MLDLYQRAEFAAKANCHILLQGETGTGKDYLANYIHSKSLRSAGPLITINCAAIPEQLFESELFGYEAGAFTGAVSRKKGLLELASGGFVFLNEIALISLAAQGKLLSWLDDGRFFRLGGRQPVPVSANVISACNCELFDLVEKGLFRKDLYYRLAAVVIRIPPLRSRSAEDKKELVLEILLDLARSRGDARLADIDSKALSLLLQYDWPGNVRELKHVLKLAVALSGDKAIRSEDLELSQKPEMSLAEKGRGDCLCSLVAIEQNRNLKQALAAARDELVAKAVVQSKGNLKAASKLLGVSIDTLKYLRKMHGKGSHEQ
uniref:Sigma-54-dependent Fis family transcriptional regulator n=1 Tax=Desulfomonile tiedjei TaxID=2358 RepID=A0A7C4AQ43_9BACT